MLRQIMGPLGYLVSIGEFIGGLGLIFGFLSRFSTASLILVLLGAIAIVPVKNEFFLGQSPGYEDSLLQCLISPSTVRLDTTF